MAFKIIFDEIILAQLKRLGKNMQLKERISIMLDRIEESGPAAGKMVDSRLFIYEIKSKRHPLRLYFKHDGMSDNIYVFEYELKTSEDKQRKTISKIRGRAINLFRNLNLFL